MAEILVLFHFLFFWQFYRHPFRNATGELLSTHFTHWAWLGKELRHGRVPLKDDTYYFFPACLPINSTFYPCHWITAWIFNNVSVDLQFAVLQYLVCAHYLLGSFLAFMMFSQWYSPLVSLFGALTLTHAAYNIKLSNTCIAYTLAWIPGLFIKGWLGPFSFAMACLGGYYPVLVYITPFAAIFNPNILWGLIPGLIQIGPMLWYWPKTIRTKTVDQTFGRVPWWRFSDLVFPGSRGQTNGVNFPESAMYMGVLPLIAIFSSGVWMLWIPVLIAICGMTGLIKAPFRVPARFTYVFVFFMICIAVNGFAHFKHQFILILIQALDLLRNRDLYPTFPFAEWPRKPSEHLSAPWIKKLSDAGRYRVAGLPYPFFTGYWLGVRTCGYTGGFSLLDMAKFRGMDNHNGESLHHVLPPDMDEYGVKYVYSKGDITVRESAKEPPKMGILEELKCLIAAH